MMTQLLIEQLIALVEPASALYQRLILLVGPHNSGKTAVLRTVHNQLGCAYVSVSRELAQQLLSATERQRLLYAAQWFSEMVAKTERAPVLLDSIELLFERSLQLNPLPLLERISINHTLVVAWNGTIEQDHLIYGWPGHPEYRRYPCGDLLIVQTS